MHACTYIEGESVACATWQTYQLIYLNLPPYQVHAITFSLETILTNHPSIYLQEKVTACIYFLHPNMLFLSLIFFN